MIKKLFTKYFLEVVPSIVATVVGAYIVTHYINAKSEADKPKAAIAAPAGTSKDAAPQTLKGDDKAAKTESAKSEAARLKAEKLALEKAAAERAASDRVENAKKAAEKLAAEKAATEKAAAEKAAVEKLASDKAAAERRERAVAKAAPVALPSPETNAAPDDKRDANDLARAAIERLRNATPRPSESHRAPDAAAVRVEEPARQQERAKINSVVFAPAATQQPPVQPLPPAVTVAPPPSEAAIVAPPAPFPTPMDSPDVRATDASRPMPPADIPPRSLDSRAEGRGHSVAEGVVSAAKSVFQAVLPERN